MQDEASTDSVFDFLYHDAPRIGSFLAQFEEAGHLRAISEGDQSSRAAQRGFSVKAGLSVPSGMPGADGPEASVTLGREPGATASQHSVRTYDPYWTNARTFLDYADGAGLLLRDLSKARVGQLVLIGGRLSVLDTRIVKAALDMPALSSAALASAPGPNTAIGLEIFKVLPMEIQATVHNADGSSWMTLSEDHMAVSSSDLLLKHGHEIAGWWSVVGVLDALPDNGGAIDPQVQAAMSTAIESAASFSTNAVGLVAMLIAPMARLAMGRPAAARGITPLLIFREVSGA